MELSLMSFFMISFVTAAAEREMRYPAVKDYGGIRLRPGTAMPDKALDYKVVFDIGRPAESNSQIVPGLIQMATLVNALSVAGVPAGNIEVVGILHGGATKAAIMNEAYKDHFYTENPNGRLISELKKTGAQLFVCAQALEKNSFRMEWISPDISPSFSAPAMISAYQLKGYALLSE